MRQRLFTSPERIWLWVGCIAGVAFIAITPPFKGADEPAHFYRAYQVSEGGWRAERQGDLVGGVLPRSLAARNDDSGVDAVPLQAGDRTMIDFRTTAPYAPIAYLPQAWAIAVGRALRLSPVYLLYLGRGAGLVASLLLIALALRVAPTAKHLLLLIAVTPMTLRQLSLLTADSLTIASAFLYLAIILRLAMLPAAAHRAGWVAAMLASGIALTLSKLAYAPMLLLVLLCPPEAFHTRRRRLITVFGFVAAGAATVALWLWAIRALYVPQPIAPDADPVRQLAFIRSEPIAYAAILISDLRRNASVYAFHCLGYVAHVPPILGWLHLAALVCIAAVDCGRPRALAAREKAIILLVAVATYVLINTLNYFGWSAVGAATIGFIQGRYYLPIAPLVFLLLSNRRFANTVSVDRLTAWSGWLAIFVVAVALYALGVRWILS